MSLIAFREVLQHTLRDSEIIKDFSALQRFLREVAQQSLARFDSAHIVLCVYLLARHRNPIIDLLNPAKVSLFLFCWFRLF